MLLISMRFVLHFDRRCSPLACPDIPWFMYVLASKCSNLHLLLLNLITFASEHFLGLGIDLPDYSLAPA